ncbi:hypothetical protein DER45DRAFT_578198 [Fusarium avenaceum]|nr:hypothetical protein DER45DRAFT_578198 [Fusarium avenaceum]
MFTHPTPEPNINTQSRTQNGVRNRPVANNHRAVQGNLSTLNTNLFPQYEYYPLYGYTSPSPLPMSSSSIGYSSFNPTPVNQHSFSAGPIFSAVGEWPCPDINGSAYSQVLMPTGRSEVNELAMRRLRTWVWFILRARVVLRNAREKKGRRHSASDCPSWSAGTNYTNHSGSSLSPPGWDGMAYNSMVTDDQGDPLGSFGLPSTMFPDNILGIMTGDGNSLLPEQADIPRQATVLSEEEVLPYPGLGSAIGLGEATPSESVSSQHQPGVISSSRSRKRPIDCVDIGDSSAEETEHKPRNKKRSVKASNSNSPLFACPFYKHDPERYEAARSCCGPGWSTVHRLKEHIFRSHKLPEHQCRRCLEVFEGEVALYDHSRSPDGCKVQTCNSQEEGIDAGQEKLLHARAKKRKNTESHQKKVEEGRWNEVYRIIFPDEDQVPSPYYNHLQKLTVDEFGRKMVAEFDKLILAELGSVILQPISLTNIVKVTRSVVLKSIESCRQDNEDIGSQHSRLTVSQSQNSQLSLGVGSQLHGVNNDLSGMLDSESLAQMLSMSNMGFDLTGSWNNS